MNKKTSIVMATLVSAIMCTVLAACQPQAPDEKAQRRQAADPQLQEMLDQPVEWTIQSECVVCHEAEHVSQEDLSYQMGATGQTQMECVECHNDSGGLEKAHTGLTLADFEGADRLKNTVIPSEVCLACHQSDYTPEKTADTMLVDKNGTDVNPHDLPQSESHDSITCASCHKMHSTDPIAETAQASCLGCHHQNVYECKTCHT